MGTCRRLTEISEEESSVIPRSMLAPIRLAHLSPDSLSRIMTTDYYVFGTFVDDYFSAKRLASAFHVMCGLLP